MTATRLAMKFDEADSSSNVLQIARIPGMRALAWSGQDLFASRGYQLFRGAVREAEDVKWDPVGSFRAGWTRRISAANRITSRLFRGGFHALAILPNGGLVAAIAGAIVTLGPNESEFRQTHEIRRGTRPLHIAAIPDGTVYWGEYFDNAARDEVHIYGSTDGGASWNIAYTFPRGSIRHVHNIVHDRWENCVWILTGDYGNECRILRAACDLSRVDTVLQGNQQARAVALVPGPEGLYFSSDTPLEKNYVYLLDRRGKLSRRAEISSSSIYGCRVGESVFFSTMIEPSEVNRDRCVRIYRGRHMAEWRPVVEWKKDFWPMGLFQYGNAFLPDGNNETPYLAATTAAVKSHDGVTWLYRVNR